MMTDRMKAPKQHADAAAASESDLQQAKVKVNLSLADVDEVEQLLLKFVAACQTRTWRRRLQRCLH